MKIVQVLGIALIFGVLSYEAHAEGRTYGEVQDHYTQKYVDEPTVTTVCSDRVVGGDKTGDTLMGAIIGGIIGNQIGDSKNNGAAGAVIGGMIGHNNSDAEGKVVQECRKVTTYNRVYREVYSHSTVTFTHNGREYTIRFQR